MPSQKFKLHPLKVGVDGGIEGFRVEAAVAGCAALTQNVILSNNVKAAALYFNLRLVQYLCRINGMPMEEYSRFELRHVRLVDVELTYLFKLKTAKAVQVAPCWYAADDCMAKKAKFYGSGGSYTLCVETPGGIIKVYIKDLESAAQGIACDGCRRSWRNRSPHPAALAYRGGFTRYRLAKNGLE